MLQFSGFCRSPRWLPQNQPGSWFIPPPTPKAAPVSWQRHINIFEVRHFNSRVGLMPLLLEAAPYAKKVTWKLWGRPAPWSHPPSSHLAGRGSVLLWAGTQAGVEGWAGWSSHVLLSPSSEVDTEALTMEVRRRRDQAVPNCGFSFHLPDYLLPSAGVQFALIVALVPRVTIKPIWASPPAVFYCLTIICLL